MAKKGQKKAKSAENKKESLLVTRESLSATIALFACLASLILCTGSAMFGEFGFAVCSFLTGIFGFLAYPIMLGILYLSVMSLIGKKLVKNRRAGWCIALVLLCASLIVHTALTFRWSRDGYLAQCFLAGENFPKVTVTGWLGGLAVFGLATVMSNIGAIVIFSLLTLFFGYLTYLSVKMPVVKKEKTAKAKKHQPANEKVVEQTIAQPVQPQMPTPNYVRQGTYQGIAPMPQITRAPEANGREIAMGDAKQGGAYSPFGQLEQMNKQPVQTERRPQDSREILFGGNPAENYKKNLLFDPKAGVNNRPIEVEPTANPYVPSYTDSYQNSVNEGTERYRSASSYAQPAQSQYVQEPIQRTREEEIQPLSYLQEEEPARQETLSYPIYEETPTSTETSFGFGRSVETEKKEEEKPYQRHEYMEYFSPENPRLFENETGNRGEELSDRSFGREEPMETFRGRDYVEEPEERSSRGLDIFDEPEEDPYTLREEETPRRVEESSRSVEEPSRRVEETPRRMEEIDITDRGARVEPASYLGLTDRNASRGEPTKEPEQPKPPKPRIIRPYKRVPLDDFDCRDVEPCANDVEVEQTKQDIIATLEDFKVTGATIASVTFGPTVTRYNVALPRSISPRKIVALDQSIAISLHSSGVNIYPNYEDGVVSIEVPNKERQFVQLGCMLSGNTFVNAPAGSLMFAMGKNVANAKIYGDISKMIHLLVAGSSGSGKSVFLGALIVSMIYKYSPEELRLILIDPKKTEFVLYNNLPHLMINEIITDVNKAVQSLNWAIGEMNRRYTLFEQMSRSGKYVVNLDQYNEQLEKNQRLPKIVIIIDELADLMLAAKKDIEDKIQNLTQKARAAGIHLIVATQRPSADVITGVIKSNLSTRIAFAVASEVDSRVILDQSGAQKLLGKGDFLYSMPGINTPVRVQSAFISPGDSQKVVNYIKANNEAYYDEEATAYINNTRMSGDDSSSGDKAEIDPMSIEALRHVILSGSASISMIQRKCSAGYNRAGKIIEWMEDMGYISAFDGAKARKVLITKEEFESKYGPL